MSGSARRAWAIARRDLGGLVAVPSGWIVAAAAWFLAGLFWVALLDGYLARSADRVVDPYGGARLTLSDHLLTPWMSNLALVVMLVAPAVAMRAFAEETRSGSAALLATSPVGPGWIALGKWAGAGLWVLGWLFATLPLPLVLALWAPVDVGLLAAGYLGLALLALAVTALGVLASSFTDQQLVALVVSVSGTLALWVLGGLDADPTSWAAQASLSGHLQDPVRGALRASDLAYFALLTAVALFATRQRVDAWRSA